MLQVPNSGHIIGQKHWGLLTVAPRVGRRTSLINEILCVRLHKCTRDAALMKMSSVYMFATYCADDTCVTETLDLSWKYFSEFLLWRLTQWQRKLQRSWQCGVFFVIAPWWRIYLLYSTNLSMGMSRFWNEVSQLVWLQKSRRQRARGSNMSLLQIDGYQCGRLQKCEALPQSVHGYIVVTRSRQVERLQHRVLTYSSL